MRTRHTWVFITGIVLLLVLLFQALMIGDWEYLFDRLFGMVQIVLLWVLWQRFRISLPVLLTAAFAIFLHQLKLYGNTYFGLGFDNYMHFIGTFAIALIIYGLLRTCQSRECRHPLKLYLLVFFTAVGAAAVIEPLEYLGYAELGVGDGILFYGAGDGGWRDTAADLSANILGAAAALMYLYIERQGKRH